MSIEPKASGDRDRLLEVLALLGREDPTFRFRENEETGELLVSGMGELHLEVIVNRLRSEFKVPVEMDAEAIQAVRSLFRPMPWMPWKTRTVNGPIV